MAILTLNGADMPTPTSLTVHLEDAGFTAQRALSGNALVTRAAVKRRIEIYWAYLTPSHIRLLLSAAAQDEELSLSYPDPLTGDIRQMNAYSAARRVEMKRMRSDGPVWTGVQMTFIEC